jgi:hypothetical protein
MSITITLNNPFTSAPNEYGKAVGGPVDRGLNFIKHGGLSGVLFPGLGDAQASAVEGGYNFIKRGGLAGAIIPGYGDAVGGAFNTLIEKPLNWIKDGGILGHL